MPSAVRLRSTQGAGETPSTRSTNADTDGGQFFAVALNLLLNWMFTLHFGWGHRGLAFSTAAGYQQLLILYFLMRSHLGPLESRAMLRCCVKWRWPRPCCWVFPGGRDWLLADGRAALLAEVREPRPCHRRGAAAFFFCANALGIGEVHGDRPRRAPQTVGRAEFRRGRPAACVAASSVSIQPQDG